MAVRHFYVSSVVGTNTGTTDTSYASAQTGAMSALTASNVYDRIGRVLDITVPPTDEDIIYIADDHSAAYDKGTRPVFNDNGAIGGAGLTVASVDAANVDLYKPGAVDEQNDGANDYEFQGDGILAGFDLKTSDDVLIITAADSRWQFQDSILRLSTGTGDLGLRLSGAGAAVRFKNVEIVSAAALNNILNIIGDTKFIWCGGSLSGTETTGNFTSNPIVGQIDIIGVDLSNHSGTLMSAISASGDNALMRLINCTLNSGVVLHGSLGGINHRFEMYNCDDASGDALHRFYIADAAGSARNNDAIYVTATKPWYGGSVKSSIEVRTNPLCNHAHPFTFELPAQYVNLALSASDLLTINLVTDSTALSLTDTDIAAFLVYPDGTTSVIPNWVTSGKTATGYLGIDPLAAGTALGTSALDGTDWNGEPASANFYKMELDTSGNAGQATAVGIRIEVYKPSILAGDLFIHPLLTVS